MAMNHVRKQPPELLFPLPCACQNLRRATRAVTRIYDRELRKAGIEVIQFGLLTALGGLFLIAKRGAREGMKGFKGKKP